MSEWSVWQWLYYGLAFVGAWVCVGIVGSTIVGPILRRRRQAMPRVPNAENPPQREP